MKKFISSILIALSIIYSLTACSAEQTPEAKQPTEITNSNAADASKTLPTVDRANNQITVPEEINTIITMAPSIAEVLVDIGYGDKIIAADTQSKNIEGLPENIPYIDMMAPDAEQIIALKPDVIFASTMSLVDGNDPFKQLIDMGICVVYIPSSDSIEGIYEDIMFISNVMESNEKGQVLVDNMKTKIEEIKKISSTIEDKKSVYFEIAAAPSLYSFGTDVFLNEMIDIIGAKNVLSDQKSWIAVSEEAILAANPDVIITNVNYIEKPVDEILSRNGWDSITAVKNKNVYYVDNMASSLPNHHIIKALEEMAGFVYPDKY